MSPSPAASASHLHTYATDPIQMRQKLDENLLEKNQFKASKEMMRNIEFNVPIDELYKVVASCNYNINNFYCPVLVKIVDETILDRMTRKAYLLQVWNKLGEMVFERSLNQPVANWNISGDIFMYQEDSKDSHIWLIKLYKQKSPHIFKITLPDGVMDSENRVNSYFDK